jgi:hypothetical protein
MARPKVAKPVLVAVKVDAETAAVLDTLPNKSEFIRDAVRARLDELCPLCGGTGLRPTTPLARPGSRHLHVLPRARCADCGRESPVVPDVDAGAAERTSLLREISRLKTFLAWGDYFCAGCYGRSVTCDRCGHRIAGAGPAREAHACGAS